MNRLSPFRHHNAKKKKNEKIFPLFITCSRYSILFLRASTRKKGKMARTRTLSFTPFGQNCKKKKGEFVSFILFSLLSFFLGLRTTGSFEDSRPCPPLLLAPSGGERVSDSSSLGAALVLSPSPSSLGNRSLLREGTPSRSTDRTQTTFLPANPNYHLSLFLFPRPSPLLFFSPEKNHSLWGPTKEDRKEAGHRDRRRARSVLLVSASFAR